MLHAHRAFGQRRPTSFLLPKARTPCQRALSYSNDRWTRMPHMVPTASKSFLRYMRHWRHFLRDRDRSLEFALDVARGTSLLRHIASTFVFSDLHILKNAGIFTSDLHSDVRRKRLCTDSASVVATHAVGSLTKFMSLYARRRVSLVGSLAYQKE